MQEAQVVKFSGWMAILALAATAAWAQAPAAGDAKKKNVKDQAEYDLFDAVKKDLLQNNGTKAVQDLNAWKQHNPDSDYKDDRELMYVQAYNMAKQYDKTLDQGKALMGKDLDAMFTDPAQGPRLVLNFYFGVVTAALQLQNPTPDQLAIGVEAAHKLLDYKRVPSDVAPDAWKTAKNQVDAAANAMIFRAAILPCAEATQKRDYAAGEAACTKASTDFPDKSLPVYELGVNLRGEKKDDQAMWEFARAVAIDPTLGGTQNGAQITTFVKNFYKGLHGADDGYDQILQQAKAGVTLPPGFHVPTAQEVAEAQQKQFQTSHPDIALFMNLKATLTSDQGPAYFDANMKGAEVPELKGTVLESACRAKELKVAVPLPDAQGPPTPEITLKLVNDAGAPSPLTGKAEQGVITFKAVAESFTKDPFMLTMTIDKKAIQDLKVTPCAAPARRGPVRKK